MTVTNLGRGKLKKIAFILFEDGKGKNCSKTFLGSPLKTKTMAINFGIL